MRAADLSPYAAAKKYADQQDATRAIAKAPKTSKGGGKYKTEKGGYQPAEKKKGDGKVSAGFEEGSNSITGGKDLRRDIGTTPNRTMMLKTLAATPIGSRSKEEVAFARAELAKKRERQADSATRAGLRLGQ